MSDNILDQDSMPEKNSKSLSLGYTTGVFDLFHIGHVSMLRNARAMCDRLIVGVTTDELLLKYKKKQAVFHPKQN